MNAIKNIYYFEMVPLTFHLSQNYPNPFNDKTKIKYCVAYRTNVKISIQNSEGIEVENLVNDKKDPGTYEFEFDGGTLPGGIYLCRLNAGNFSAVKEMFLLK